MASDTVETTTTQGNKVAHLIGKSWVFPALSGGLAAAGWGLRWGLGLASTTMGQALVDLGTGACLAVPLLVVGQALKGERDISLPMGIALTGITIAGCSALLSGETEESLNDLAWGATAAGLAILATK